MKLFFHNFIETKLSFIEPIKTSIADLTLLDERIIHILVEDHSEFGMDEMLEIREANAKLAQGKPYCVMIESGSFAEFSKKAKEASASKEHSENRIALAIIIHNLAMKLISDIYLRVNKPVCPTKAFRDKEEALKWLKSMKKVHDLNQNNSKLNKSAS